MEMKTREKGVKSPSLELSSQSSPIAFGHVNIESVQNLKNIFVCRGFKSVRTYNSLAFIYYDLGIGIYSVCVCVFCSASASVQWWNNLLREMSFYACSVNGRMIKIACIMQIDLLISYWLCPSVCIMLHIFIIQLLFIHTFYDCLQ